LRPILLTSATTVLGLAPMAIAGGALWQPMAVLMMSGLAIASLLTLFFVPAGYFLLFRFDKKLQGHHHEAWDLAARSLRSGSAFSRVSASPEA
jgi:predicted RND superfamily exporter protein